MLIAVTIAATLIAPIVTSVNDNTGTVSVTNESVTADVGNYVDLDGWDIDSGSETVYYDNNSDGNYDTAAASDYTLNESEGTIRADSGGSIDDGAAMLVSYDYQATSGTTTTVVDLIPMFLGLLIMGVLAFRIQRMM